MKSQNWKMSTLLIMAGLFITPSIAQAERLQEITFRLDRNLHGSMSIGLTDVDFWPLVDIPSLRLGNGITEVTEVFDLDEARRIGSNTPFTGNRLGFFAEHRAYGDSISCVMLPYGTIELTDDLAPQTVPIVLNDFECTGGCVQGDINGDGSVNFADIPVLSRLLRSSEDLSDLQKCRADANKDGAINMQDLRKLASSFRRPNRKASK